MGWFDPAALRLAADIPEDKPIRLVIGVGYAAEGDPAEKVRKPLEAMLHYLDEE